MVAQIERNPRQGVELRERAPESLGETIAAIGCYWLVFAAAYALFTGRTLPLFVGLVVFGVALYRTRARR